MTQRWLLGISAGVLCAALNVAAQTGTVNCTVVNKTTGQPAGDVEVVLIQLQGTMQEAARGKSDAQGRFTFHHPGLGAQPMLVRAVYHGVNFNTPVPPGRSEAEIDVYDLSKDSKTIAVTGHVVIFQPNGSTMLVGEEYSVQNNSQPPQAYFKSDGNFEFAIPAETQLQQVAATGPSGMPVVQASIDRGKDHYAIAYAFRPGDSSVRLSYEVPYSGNAASVKLPTTYSSARLLLVAPPGLQVTADGLAAQGQEQGMNVFAHEALAANAALTVNVSGIAAPGTAPREADNPEQGAQEGNSRAATAEVQAIPGRLDQWKWYLLGGFAVLFTMAGLLLKRTQVVVAAPDRGAIESAPQAPRKDQTANATAPTLAAVDAQVGTSLDALKDTLFRLELRRQAGTISEAEYAQERARVEKLLRDLVRG
jgi:hypothetical protein